MKDIMSEDNMNNTFEKIGINTRTSISYSPEINLIRINNNGNVITIPGAGRIIDFLTKTRKDHEQRNKRLRHGIGD